MTDGGTISTRDYVISLCVLSLCVFTNGYLLISVFPYSGYMAIALIDGVDEDNAGSYAGLLAASFMIGRAIMAVPFGQAADTYGRVAILYISLSFSALFNLLFGLSPTFAFAIATRFLLGFSNGIFSTIKVMVSELAGGDKDVQAKAMGIVMGMWAFAILFSPAIAGFLSDPIKQYPELFQDTTSFWYILLDECKFFLPNLVGFGLCLLSILSLGVIKETLHEDKIRPSKYIVPDIMAWINEVLCCKPHPTHETTERTPLIQDSIKRKDELGAYVTTLATPTDGNKKDDQEEKDEDNSDDEYELPSQMSAALMNFVQDDVDDAIRQSVVSGTGGGAGGEAEAGMLSLPKTRRSIVNDIEKRTSIVAAERRRSSMMSTMQTASREASIASKGSPLGDAMDAPSKPSIASVWASINTRNHMIVYWIASFYMVAVDEGFPLYCISTSSGLGLSEGSIGSIISASGLVYVFGQFFVYSAMLACLGLYSTIRVASFFFGFVVILLPLSQYMNVDTFDVVDNDDDGPELNLTTFIFLSVVLSIYRIMGICFLSSVMVATNRTVTADVRATMNGLQTLGGSVVKGVAPIFAGLLVSFVFASGYFSAEFGSWLMWFITSMFGIVGSIASCVLLHDDDDD